jgi:hypothetical protein
MIIIKMNILEVLLKRFNKLSTVNKPFFLRDTTFQIRNALPSFGNTQ